MSIGEHGDILYCFCGKVSVETPEGIYIQGCHCLSHFINHRCVPAGTIPVVDEKEIMIHEYAVELGKPIVAPKGWTMIPEGGRVPHVHRYYIEGHGWSDPKRTISTMTPAYARRWGYMLAFAVPEGTVQEPWDQEMQKRIERDLKDLHVCRSHS